MKKVVVITYYWPPAGGPGVQRWLAFTKYLREYGIEPTVVVPDNPTYPLQDQSLLDEIPTGLKVVRVPISEPYGLARKLSRKKTNTLSRGIIEKGSPSLLQRFLLYIRGNFFIPDARVWWVKPVVRRVQSLMEEGGIGTVITTGPPHSVHLAGREVKARTGAHWIADFRDPWTTIGYHGDLMLGSRAGRRHRELESKVLKGADQVVVTSYTTRDEFAGKTGKPVHLVTNGFDVAIARGEETDEKFTLTHVGSLLSGRNPVLLWDALRELVEAEPGFRDDLAIRLVGATSADITAVIREYGLEPYLEMIDYLDHDKAIAVQRRAQLLLLIEIDRPETRAIIPGKLFEYLAAKRPILAIGPGDWDAARIVAGHQAGCVFTYGDRDQLRDQLRKWYRDFKGGVLESTSENIEEYSRKRLTGKLAAIVKQNSVDPKN